jgi:murein DD-endopeptidase MepM/ murein hydrolase activator NlpD
MTPYNRLLFLLTLVNAGGIFSVFFSLYSVKAATPNCPVPALQRFQRHQASDGETLQSIAQRYNLLPTTIIRMNPALRNSTVKPGSEILIPPFNGIVVEVPRGQTVGQIASRYRVRPDVLFEINGCQKNPRVVFVPTPNSSRNRAIILASPNTNMSGDNTTPITLAGYPLATVAQVALPYGWQTNPSNGEVFFHSGIDLLAPAGTPVQAVDAGKVVFAGEQGTYGNLVIINHAGGVQSRYAQLEKITVFVGQQLQPGEEVGIVGSTGQPSSNETHLHFEIRSSSSLGWVAKDPKEYLKQ